MNVSEIQFFPKKNASTVSEAVAPQTNESVSLGELIDQAMATVRKLILAREAMHVACSFGKDSVSALNLVLMTAKQAKEEGLEVPPIFIVTADTLVENPEISAYVSRMQNLVRQFAMDSGLNITVKTVYPSLLNSWAVSIIGGRKLPQFANKSTRDCSIDYKKTPAMRYIKQVRRELKQEGFNLVTIIGTRRAESAGRRARMDARGDSASDIKVQEDGSRTLALVADWSTDEIWEYLAMCGNHGYRMYPAFAPDFQETCDIYKDATGECQIVATEKGEKSAACGARFGCATCTIASTDRSMETMLLQDKYAYMRDLNKLRNFLVNTQYDLNLRRQIGLDIEQSGYIWVGPNTYSDVMVENLLRWCLTIDAREQEAAQKLGIAPRFQMISVEMLFAIDVIWMRDGRHPNKAFHAIYLYDQVYNQGARFDVPEVPPSPVVKIPAKRWLKVGMYDQTGIDMLTDDLVKAFAGPDTGCDASPRVDSSFSVDGQGASLVLEFELEKMLQRHDDPSFSNTGAFQWHVMYGTVAFPKGKLAQQDHMLKRGQFWERLGLAGDIDINSILPMTISDAEHKEIARGMGIKLNDEKRQEIREGIRQEKAKPAKRLTKAERLAVPAGEDSRWAWLDGKRIKVAVGTPGSGMVGYHYVSPESALFVGYPQVHRLPVKIGESLIAWDYDAQAGAFYLLAYEPKRMGWKNPTTRQAVQRTVQLSLFDDLLAA